MNFRTNIASKPYSHPFAYKDKILLVGSCFSDSIGEKLKDNLFQVTVNPFGVIYNPASMSTILGRIMNKQYFHREELFFHDDLWHHFLLHGQFSNEDPELLIRKANETLDATHSVLMKLDYLFITFGTAWIYEQKENNKIVSNCHKVPANQFIRRRMEVEEMSKLFLPCLEELLVIRPELKIIFTVSPIRHRKDGEHENQLSKASLLLAIEQICSKCEVASYFPAYEIMMDDLRDYRFYKEDLIHPSAMAVDYIFQHLYDSWMDSASRHLMCEIQKIRKSLSHRPSNMHSAKYKTFLQVQKQKIEQLKEQHPYLDFGVDQIID